MKKFQVKDIIFLAVLAAVTTLFGILGMPVMRSEIFGLQTLATCLFYTIFASIGIMKVRKPGTLTLFGLFTGFPLLFMAPVMFFNNTFSAFLSEIISFVLYKGYKSKTGIVAGAANFMILTVPLSLPFSIWLSGSSYERFLSTGLIASLIDFVGVILLSVVGALIGVKIATELIRAGKLKAPEEG